MPKMVIRMCLRHRRQAAFGHKTECYEVGTALAVQIGPMAVFPARRQTLRTMTVRQAFERGIYPSEAQGFLHHIEVGNTIGTGRLGSVGRYPTFPGCQVIGSEPLPEL